MKTVTIDREKCLHHLMAVFFMLFAMGAEAQIVLHDAADVTQTRATLSADFPDLDVTHGFQYKYGTLPEVDDFSRLALAELSDPVLLTTTGNAWSARTVKRWVESKSGLQAGQSSVMQAKATFTRQTDVSFEWSVDSEEGIGVLSFIVDGQTEGSISGEVGFTTVTYTVSAGAHTFQWQYEKSAETNVGLDIGMVRNINFQNTTEGDWIKAETTGKSVTIERLYPGCSYVYRAFSPGTSSPLRSFQTDSVTLHDFGVSQVSQTTATIHDDLTKGDAAIRKYLTYGELWPDWRQDSRTMAAFQESSLPVTVTTTRSYWNANTDEFGDEVLANSVYGSSVSGYAYPYFIVNVYLDEPATLSFDWRLKDGGGYIYFKIDNGDNIHRTRMDDYETLTYELSAGMHTLCWEKHIYSQGTAYLKNVKIGNRPTFDNTQQTIQIADDEDYRIEKLFTNRTYKCRESIVIEADPRLNIIWPTMYSEWVSFSTLNVYADTLPVSNLRQASVTIRGKVDGGDATVTAAGLQYKDAAGTRWTDLRKGVADTLLTHTVTRLRPNTNYHYRSYIQAQDCDTVFSETGQFSTLAVEARKPVLVRRTQHTAELEGKVVFGDASIYQRGMQFRKAGSEEWEEVEDGGNDSIYTLKETGLEMKSDYQARTYIQPAGSDIIYSDILDFRTKSVEVYIDSITNVYQRNAAVHGRIDCTDEPLTGGRVSVYKVVGGLMSDLVKTIDIPTSDSLFVQKVTGLQPNTSYCFIAELDYGEGHKAYSNIHESDVTEADAYKKALIAPESYADIADIGFTYGENWQATDEGLYLEHYYASMRNDLTATFTLTKTTTIIFNWSVARGYSNSNTYIELFADGKKNRSWEATDNNRTFSTTETLTLNAGRHTLTWRPHGSGKFYVRNLVIPADAFQGISLDSTMITTRDFFKANGVMATDVTQTKAFLMATLEETDENVEGYEFRYNVTDVLNLNQGENDERVVTVPVERGTNGNLSQQISGLYPSQSYCFAAVAKLDGMSFASPIAVFKTSNVIAWISVYNITQTSATAQVTMTGGDAEVQDLQYYVYGAGVDDWQKVYGTISLTGLRAAYTYYINIRWTVAGKQYSYSRSFTTLSTSVTGNATETAQTSAVVGVSPNCGTATYVKSGFILANDSVVSVPLGETARLTELSPNTSYTVQPFLETVEGGTVYGNSVTFVTKAISATTKPVSSISNRSATMNGTIDCDSYSSAEFGFQWKQMEGWNSDPAFTKGVKNDDGSISVALVNGMLEPNTDYQYRTAVRYKGQIYHAGNWETFRTESEYVYYPASVYTVFRTDRENNRLILCGYYVAGSETVASQGYEYWSNQSDARSYMSASAPSDNVVTITTDESMQYSLDMATLTNGNYSVRAFVVTSSGIKTYGETLTFGVQNGIDAIESVEGRKTSISTNGTTITVHNATSLVCSIYSANGACITRRRLMNDEEKFDLHRHNVYIVRLSNGESRKIKL